MRQTHINEHVNTIAVKTEKHNVKTIRTKLLLMAS